MLRYKTNRAWFSRLLWHRPGNGADLFLQPWNPHWALGRHESVSHQHLQIHSQSAFICTSYLLTSEQHYISNHAWASILLHNTCQHTDSFESNTKRPNKFVSVHLAGYSAFSY